MIVRVTGHPVADVTRSGYASCSPAGNVQSRKLGMWSHASWECVIMEYR